jgi:hypothetical protein
MKFSHVLFKYLLPTDEIFIGNRILIIYATQILSWTILYLNWMIYLYLSIYLFILYNFKDFTEEGFLSLQTNKMKFICMEKKQNPRPPCANKLDKRENSPSVCWEPGS